jgi:hypothetical protein
MVKDGVMATIGDLVLIYQEESPATFARIEDIWADKKPDWYEVKLLLLQTPVVEVVWILREAYLNGEPFTMNGVKVRLEKVEAPSTRRRREEKPPGSEGAREEGKENQGKVISLFDRKKG